MIERIFYVTVPINDAGVYEYNYGVEESDNLINYCLNYDEAIKFLNFDGFEDMCNEFNLPIDYAESIAIEYDKVNSVLAICENINGIPNIVDALHKALIYKKSVYLDF